MEPGHGVPRLGVGLVYGAGFRPFIEQHGDCVDYVEVIPDTMWTDLGPGANPRYRENAEAVDFVRGLSADKPVVLHGIGLSIGSAHYFNRDHVDEIKRWYEWLKFPWHSDHLSYNRALLGDDEVNVGVTLPLPFDLETIEILAPRIRQIRDSISAPFLLENNAYFFAMPDQELGEAEFLNVLCSETGCGLLLDLHNLYTNARNGHIDPYSFLQNLDLANVIEIHLAGGMDYDGFYLDSHSTTSPAEVWDLLEMVLPQCPNLGGLAFELLDSWLSEIGEQRLMEQLSRMKEMWMRRRGATV